ncbi:hypothetical protein [Streptomyces tsukubensis]|uniref:Secreted protein n=1 Tax=Streptomyces tsukubensis TaxID=83656 RepID=A0A1V4A420_9ACTN|nr:hypothetical protein [Streptomyces tsukubensis]OON74387.1 hypothetical protein B1H18_25155 [Streptomyces tsukubensis]QFR95376.1 hypothetical protein GBW32_23055 [Streptomyces tsukubensis]
MKTRRMKALVATSALAGAIGLTVMGAGSASASNITPRYGLKYSTLGECLTYGNEMAQIGALHGYSCPLEGDGKYHFYWTP